MNPRLAEAQAAHSATNQQLDAAGLVRVDDLLAMKANAEFKEKLRNKIDKLRRQYRAPTEEQMDAVVRDMNASYGEQMLEKLDKQIVEGR